MSGGCTNCDDKVKSAIRDREAIIKTASEQAKKDNIEYCIYREGGEWRALRIDIALREGVHFEQVISQHLQR